MKVERIPPQTPEEIQQIRASFDEEFSYLLKKEDRKQLARINKYIKDEDYYS